MTIRNWRPFARTFLSEAGRRRVVDAIAAAEKGTSGEIRVHIEARSGKDALERARVVFDRLGMANTARRNGVLLYVATADRRFAIVGDEGIHREVGDGYWEAIRERMEEHFRRGDFAEGLCEAVARVGEVLRSAFPAQAGDADELSNELSIGPDEPDAGRS